MENYENQIIEIWQQIRYGDQVFIIYCIIWVLILLFRDNITAQINYWREISTRKHYLEPEITYDELTYIPLIDGWEEIYESLFN